MSATLKQFINTAISIIQKVKTNTNDQLDIMITGVLAKQYELLHSIQGLLNQELYGSIPILIRSLYEGFIDIKMSIKDDTFFKSLYLRYLASEYFQL